jgi:hypothetical protein
MSLPAPREWAPRCRLDLAIWRARTRLCGTQGMPTLTGLEAGDVGELFSINDGPRVSRGRRLDKGVWCQIPHSFDRAQIVLMNIGVARCGSASLDWVSAGSD